MRIVRERIQKLNFSKIDRNFFQENKLQKRFLFHIISKQNAKMEDLELTK